MFTFLTNIHIYLAFLSLTSGEKNPNDAVLPSITRVLGQCMTNVVLFSHSLVAMAGFFGE